LPYGQRWTASGSVSHGDAAVAEAIDLLCPPMLGVTLTLFTHHEQKPGRAIPQRLADPRKMREPCAWEKAVPT
jgi:hypothetical protein